MITIGRFGGKYMGEDDALRPEEKAFVHAFIVSDKQERYLQLLANPKKRDKITRLLYHHLDTIADRTFPIANRDHNPESVAKLLERKGAGKSCYLISPERDFDQKELPLREAVEALINQDGVALACCVSGRLAYYKAELQQYILEYTPIQLSQTDKEARSGKSEQ